MSDSGKEEWDRLGGIINAKNAREANQAYTKWASHYEEDVKNLLFVGNETMVNSSIEYIKNEETTLMLDVAAGTGMTAQSYRDAGFKGVIDALDSNAAMLQEAEKKGLYRHTYCQEVSPDQPLSAEEESYDVLTISGAMHDNHLPADCISTLLGALKSGGLLIFNSRKTEKNVGYQEFLRQIITSLAEDSKISIVKEDTIRYHDLVSPDTGEPMMALLFILRRK